jgi:glycosyltransferase involved in cell wall biosynthesis
MTALKILHLVSVADAQSIPLELALALKARLPGTVVIAAYYARGDHPCDHDVDSVVQLGATGPFDPAAIGRLRALLSAETPDIVHLHHAVSAFWCAAVAATVRPLPILVKTEHNDHGAQHWHQSAIHMMLYPFLRAIVCNSDATLASFSGVERRLAGGRAGRIYNGLDIAGVRAKTRVGRAEAGVIRIGHVGRLVPQKNQARLIRGLAAARVASGLDLRLDIVGHGPLLPELQAEARAAGVAEAVQFVGALPRAAVYQHLARWDGFVMPSSFEGFCNALVEAMAAGLPVAVSDIETLREVAGAGAIRFDQTDPGAIGAALVELAGRSRAPNPFVERYDMANTVARHVALYDRLLGTAKPVAARGLAAARLEAGGPDHE